MSPKARRIIEGVELCAALLAIIMAAALFLVPAMLIRLAALLSHAANR